MLIQIRFLIIPKISWGPSLPLFPFPLTLETLCCVLNGQTYIQKIWGGGEGWEIQSFAKTQKQNENIELNLWTVLYQDHS